DAANRLLWRAERRRLDAESLRDSMLAVSGELDLTVGGESFRPTISPEALEGLSRKTAAWRASPAEKQNRRGVYMYLKRGLLPPMMTTFDLCDVTQSCGKRDVTTVPTQALALLNNRFAHDRSERLASAIMREDLNTAARIQQVWSRILKRRPSEGELELSLRHVAVQRETFSAANDAGSPSREASEASPRRIEAALRLHLRADQATVAGKENRVVSVKDLSGENHHASQADSNARPVLSRKGLGGKPTLMFDGKGRFLKIDGQPLTGQACTILCVVSDQGDTGHRAVVSNWNRAGTSTSSLFLGLTGENTVRFCDAFPDAGQASDREKPFLLSAVNGSDRASVFQNGRLLKFSTTALTPRRLETEWVVGQQGNIDGEFWKGGIAEIRVYNRDLSDAERRLVATQLARRYGLSLRSTDPSRKLSPETLALASLCHVLMNSNEFLYVD
ncbi:MAG: DUF1553 domain-containing protein, partial [Planctomycetales bacterium]